MSILKLEKAAKLEEEIRQLTNQRKMVLQQHKEDERKKRTHRICKRGAMIESILPESKDFSDDQIKTLLEQVLTSGFAVKRIAEIMSPEETPEVSATPGVIKEKSENGRDVAE